MTTTSSDSEYPASTWSAERRHQARAIEAKRDDPRSSALRQWVKCEDARVVCGSWDQKRPRIRTPRADPHTSASPADALSPSVTDRQVDRHTTKLSERTNSRFAAG